MSKVIGIILVNYNGFHDTVECLKSIYKSTYDNYFIVIVDNNSREDCGQLASFDRIILERLNVNVGFGVANNIGAEIALKNGASYVLCLNNDTIIKEDMLEKMIERADINTIETAATYYYFDREQLWYGGGEVSKLKGTFRHKQYTESKDVSFICGCCMLVSAECIKKIGLFEKEYFMYYEDSDFSLKAKMNGYRLHYVFEAVLWHKVGKSTSKEVGMKEYYLTRNRLFILKKYKNYFGKFAIIYFYCTRLAIVFYKIIMGENIALYIDAFKDYKKNRMGKRVE